MKIELCKKCGYRHSKKECPVILGKMEKQWVVWARQYQQAKLPRSNGKVTV